MQTKNIKQKLEEMGVNLADIPLGDFDAIGEFTAKRTRQPGDRLYNDVGCFYRANYERGILINYLIKTGRLESFLEIGFGRGYATMCAAKAFKEMGKVGRIVTIDPNLNEQHVKGISQVFPKEWFEGVTFVRDFSEKALPGIEGKFDLVYIDGDHRYEAVKSDWELVKDKWNRYVLFDDYHMQTKKENAIEVARVINEVDWSQENCEEPECVVLDRRIFIDDRRLQDDQIDYGQVLITRKSNSDNREPPEYITDWLKS